MIKLDIHPYCHKCSLFKPTYAFRGGEFFPPLLNGSNERCTAVVCEERNRCYPIHEYLENKWFKEGYESIIYASWENGKCSECGAEAMTKKSRNDEGKESFQQVLTQYCPHCGAHMTGYLYKGELPTQE